MFSGLVFTELMWRLATRLSVPCQFLDVPALHTVSGLVSTELIWRLATRLSVPCQYRRRASRARAFFGCVGYAVQLGRWVTAAFRVVSEFCSSAGHMSSGMSFCRMRVVQFCWACGVFFCRIQGFLDTRGCVWFTRGLRAVREIGLLG
jgi:hypothetical protein